METTRLRGITLDLTQVLPKIKDGGLIGGDEIHRHDAHAFVYVIEGSIVMQLRGAEPVTVKAGEGFYEGPNDVHIVGRSASDSKPAKFVVFLVKNQGVPAVLPAK